MAFLFGTLRASLRRSLYEAWRDCNGDLSSVRTEFMDAEIDAFSACVRVSVQMRKPFVSKEEGMARAGAHGCGG